MKHLKRFNEAFSDTQNLKPGNYVLYNYMEVPLPIEIIEIENDQVHFDSWYNEVNKAEWEEKFIGTEMEGLGYDPFTSDFNISDVDKIEGDKIYLKSKGQSHSSDLGQASDYLKSNCRSWEYDCDNYEDTNTLAHHLQDKFPNIDSDKAFRIAADWTGYERSDEDFDQLDRAPL